MDFSNVEAITQAFDFVKADINRHENLLSLVRNVGEQVKYEESLREEIKTQIEQNDFTGEFEKLRNELKKLKREEKDFFRLDAANVKQIDRIRKDLEEKGCSEKELRKRQKEDGKAIEKARKRVKELYEKDQATRLQQNEADEKRIQLRESIEEVKKKLTTGNTEILRLKGQINASNQELELNEKRLEEIKTRMQDYVAEFERIDGVNGKLTAENEENERLNTERGIELQKLEGTKLSDPELDVLVKELEGLVRECNQHKATNESLIAESFNIQERLLMGEQNIMECRQKLKEEQSRKVELEAKHEKLILKLNQEKRKLEDNNVLLKNGFAGLHERVSALDREHAQLTKQLEIERQSQAAYLQRIQAWKAKDLTGARSRFARIREKHNAMSSQFKLVMTAEGAFMPNIPVEYIEPVLQDLGKDASNVDIRNPNLALESISNQRQELKSRIHSQTIAKTTSGTVFNDTKAEVDRIQLMFVEAEKDNQNLQGKIQGNDEKKDNWVKEKEELTKMQSNYGNQIKTLNEKMQSLKFETDKKIDERRKNFERCLEQINLEYRHYDFEKKRLETQFKRQRDEHNTKMTELENNMLRLQQSERIINSSLPSL